VISKELFKKIRRIQITTSRLVNDVMAGQYHSAFKGRGMEFSEVREYIPGDDIRTIDWNVTARFDRPFVKRFVEERELTVFFLNDISGSQGFGTAESLKSELSAEICALLAFSAIKNNDQVGSILFSDRIESFIPAGKGSTHVLRVIRDLLYQRPGSRKTNLTMALDYLGQVQKKKAVVFLVSDFMDAGYEKSLRIANKHHDLVAVIVEDPRELNAPECGWIVVEDAETGEEACIDLSNRHVLESFRKSAEDRAAARDKFLASAGIDYLKISTGFPYEAALYRFMQQRSRRMRA
jgi:uncharacterized protein (DUF58 family)